MSRASSFSRSRRSPSPLGWLLRWTSAATDLVFPPACAFCNEPSPPREDGSQLCETCVSRLGHRVKDLCPRCGKPAPAAALNEGKCADCRRRKLSFDGVRSLGGYENEVRQAVLKTKHHEHEHLAMALGSRLATILCQQPFSESPDLVVPIPMHWLSRLVRGTSAAETLARSLSSTASLPLATDLLRCRRMLKRQATLLPRERVENVRGAYSVSRSYNIAGARILLVDDVITTGATCDSAARTLRNAGAASVYAIAVARGTKLRR